MDGRNFDDLTRKLAKAGSRRSFLKGLIGGAAVMGGTVASQTAEAADCTGCPPGCSSMHTTGQGCNQPPGGNCCATDFCIGDNIRNPGAGHCGNCPGGTIFCPNPTHVAFCCDAATQACVAGECCTLPTCSGGQTCGSVTNACGTIGCGSCPDGQTCNANGQCVCVDEPASTTCAGRCGFVSNNCGNQVDCGLGNCAASTDPCQQAACNSDNTCGFTAANENGPCTDNDACTTGDHCSGGVCIGTPKVCDSPPNIQCYDPDGACGSGGQCVYTPLQNNTSCGLCQVCFGGDCTSAGSGTKPNGDCGTCQQCNGSGACENAPDGIDTFGDCAAGEICCGGACQAGPNCGCDSNADCAHLTSDTDCKVGVCNVDGVTGSCGTIPAGTDVLCRAAGSSVTCDPADYCDGTNQVCPTPDYPAIGTECGLCQVCDGAGSCVNVDDGLDPNNDCDICEVCDGAGACRTVADGTDPLGECPNDGDVCCSGQCEAGPNCGCDTNDDCASLTSDEDCKVGVCNKDGVIGTCGTVAAGTEVLCRAAGSSATCDPADYCDGENQVCPTPDYPANGTTCGLCQICDGAGACVDVDDGSDPNNDCDVCEVCDGAGACRTVADGTDPLGECPAAGDVCCGGVCQAGPNCGCDSNADCDGDPARCLEGVCNVDEDGVGTCGTRSTCTGTDICCGGSCQAGPNCGCDSDSECTSLTDNSTCKVGICLVDENGIDAACSTKEAAQGVVCRAAGASAICDPQEVCNGTDQSCPANSFAPSGTSCGSCKVCDGSGSCVDDTTFPCVCVPAAGTCTGTVGSQGNCCSGMICNENHRCEVPCDPLHPDANNPNCLCGVDSSVCPAAAPCCKTAGGSLRRCMKTGNGNCACVGNNTCTKFKNQSVCCLATEGVGECTSPKGKCTPFPPA